MRCRSGGLPDQSQFLHSERVLTAVEGHVGLIELSEPKRLNPPGISELHLHYALEEMRVDANVRVVIWDPFFGPARRPARS
jgi:hypothetical protein